MTDFKVDLSNCASEPIHIPGQIQSHGFLIALDRQYKVSHCSDNIYELLRETCAKLIGSQLRYIEELIRGDDQPGFIRDLLNIGKINKSFEQINPRWGGRRLFQFLN